ncbi:tyrosine-type recombinase/integrase [Bdellovibrio bacteriovorus]|uniref:Site-specific recombinase n=1 Tax=Bdellovibrio bacteriovorus str. Tiberius TaxID=1069642 RepID=K7ZGN1_BDEBC|nr:tyrosine-type recombinase/integrase [Bdellovibrio bacteriovorus]AFY02667.1 site-specific recombinase [Bdellovibrio bacteriovorus str. Tiberius]
MAKAFKLSENIDKYLKYMTFIKSASPLTIKHYSLDLMQAFDYENPSIKAKSISESELLSTARAAFNQWAHLSLASRNRKAATLKSFFSWAFEESLTEKDLSMQITCPKVPKKLPHFVSVDEALSVLKSFDSETKIPLKEKVLFLLLYGGGLRVSEACNLKWNEVQTTQKVLRVKGKGSKERVVALPSLTVDVLLKWKKESSFDEYVFGEKPLNSRTAYEMVRQSGIRAGLLKPLHPHALRHSFATHLLSSGANLRTLQELLGHESLQATEKYTHLGIDQLARTMENLHPLGKGK